MRSRCLQRFAVKLSRVTTWNREASQAWSSSGLDEAGGVFHTYSSYARGPEELIGTLMILDRAPKGRNETTIMDFVRRHDEYATAEPRARRAASAKA